MHFTVYCLQGRRKGEGALTVLFSLPRAIFLAIIGKIHLTTDTGQATCLCHRRHTSLLSPFCISFTQVWEESYAWNEQSTTKVSIPPGTRYLSREQRDSGAGPATLGPRAQQSYIPVAGLSWNTVAPPCQGRGDTLKPRESFLMAGEEREAVRSKSWTQEVQSTRESPHWSNLRPGRKRQEKSWNAVRFFSFFCQSSYWAWWGGWKGKGLHDTKDTVQSWCQLGTLEYWVAGVRGEGWGLSPVPSRWVKMILSKPFA